MATMCRTGIPWTGCETFRDLDVRLLFGRILAREAITLALGAVIGLVVGLASSIVAAVVITAVVIWNVVWWAMWLVGQSAKGP